MGSSLHGNTHDPTVQRRGEAFRDDDVIEQGRIDRFHQLIEEGRTSQMVPFDRTYLDCMRSRLREEFDEERTETRSSVGDSTGSL